MNTKALQTAAYKKGYRDAWTDAKQQFDRDGTIEPPFYSVKFEPLTDPKPDKQPTLESILGK